MRYAFKVSIHPLDRNAQPGDTIRLFGHEIATLNVSPEAARTPHWVEFDTCAEILATLPRMFIEPDGSFVWTGQQNGLTWQVDGVLYDQGQRLAYAEVAGSCPPDEFDQMLAAFGWPAAPLMFQFTTEGVFLSEADFRRASVR
jgi:hypothetical protein